MEKEDRCPNCDMPLEDLEACNYCSWTRNKNEQLSELQGVESKTHEEG